MEPESLSSTRNLERSDQFPSAVALTRLVSHPETADIGHLRPLKTRAVKRIRMTDERHDCQTQHRDHSRFRTEPMTCLLTGEIDCPT